MLRSAKEAPSGRITRKVPELMTWYRSVLGNREYQQDALFVSGSRKLAANKKTRILAVVCDGMGQAVYADSGYRVGLAELLVQVAVHLCG